VTAAESFTLALDRAWWPLGDGTRSAVEVVEELMEHFEVDVPPAEERALRASLASFHDWARTLAPGRRSSFALVRDPATGRADALLSWRFGEAPEGAYDRILESARSLASTDDVQLVNNSATEVAVPVGRAIIVHDIAYSRTQGLQRPARERCMAAVFPEGSSALLELTVLTLDLALFTDLPDYVTRLVSGEELGVPAVRGFDGSEV